MTDTEKIIARMKELAERLDYPYRDLAHLIDAMDVTKIRDTNEPEYNSSSLATVGDVVLKLVISDLLYERNLSRGEITAVKSAMESNESLHRFTEKYGLCHYAYNDSHFFDEAPEESRLPSGKHDLYAEAVIGAVFHDLGYEGCREWILKKVVPELESESP